MCRPELREEHEVFFEGCGVATDVVHHERENSARVFFEE
jgi:hypothetical protein